MANRKRATPRRSVTKVVNKRGYINKKTGKRVGPYKRKYKKYPDHYFTWVIDNQGRKRLAEVWIKRDKRGREIRRSYRYVDNLRLERTIEQTKEMKKYIEQNYYRSADTMTKEFPDNLAKAFKKLADSPNEYSIAIDFEKTLEQPQRVAIVKGGPTETIKIADFECFGHTHPSRSYPRPSTGDVRNMKFLQPEFIINQKGEIIFLNIEDPHKYHTWRLRTQGKDPHDSVIDSKDFLRLRNRKKFQHISPYLGFWNYHEYDQGRDMFFEETGVRIYPYRKTTKIELKDDPVLEKRMPSVPPSYMKQWQTQYSEKEQPDVPKKKRAYTTKADRTQQAIFEEYNWIAMMYLGKDKMTPEDRINHVKYQIKTLEQMREDPKYSKPILNKELEAKKKKLKMEIHYGMGPPTEQEYL